SRLTARRAPWLRVVGSAGGSGSGRGRRTGDSWRRGAVLVAEPVHLIQTGGPVGVVGLAWVPVDRSVPRNRGLHGAPVLAGDRRRWLAGAARGNGCLLYRSSPVTGCRGCRRGTGGSGTGRTSGNRRQNLAGHGGDRRMPDGT